MGASKQDADPGFRGVSLAELALPFSVFFGCIFWRFRRRNGIPPASVLLLLLSAAAMLISGCGGSGSATPTSQPRTYVFQVVGLGANSGVTQQQNVTLTITQ
jgi:hypothetical protein